MQQNLPGLFATILISDPQFSLFRLGKLAGGGIRRTLDTLPKLCKPCCRFAATVHHQYVTV